VDDSPEMLEYFKDFARSGGMVCLTALNGIEALKLVEDKDEAPFDIVFADWNMPEMTGTELIKRLKKKYGNTIVAALISATDWDVLDDDAKSTEIDDFIPKPIFYSALATCINTHVQANHSNPAAEEEWTPRFTGHTILLAEDVEINQEIVIALLEDTGITIECADNGKIAVEKFTENPDKYGLILMDIHMPEMDGYEATSLIRLSSAPRAKTIPIVAMTANVFKEDVEHCLATGMNDHLGKPVDIKKLIKCLKKYLLGIDTDD
jgi:CheY-like chemotaxis protein